MRSLVDLEVFTACEDFAASWEGTREGFLSRVDSDMVDELVFGLERFSLTLALLPVTRVVGHLWSADMLHADVCDHLVHGVKHLPAYGRLLVGRGRGYGRV
jgi:hypothetical protein